MDDTPQGFAVHECEDEKVIPIRDGQGVEWWLTWDDRKVLVGSEPEF